MAKIGGVFKGLISFFGVWFLLLQTSDQCFLQRHLGRSPSTCIPWQLGGKQLGTHARGSSGLCPLTPYISWTCFHHHGVLQPDAVWAALQGLKLGSATAAALAPPAPATSRVAQWGRYCVCATHVGPTTNQVAMTAPPDMPAPKASESKVCQVWHLPFKTPNMEHFPCVSGCDGRYPQIDEKINCKFENMNCKKNRNLLVFRAVFGLHRPSFPKTTMTSLHRPYNAEARSCFGIGVLLRLWRQQTPQVVDVVAGTGQCGLSLVA